MAVATRVDERWSLDFVHDQLVDTSISGVRVAHYLDELLQARSTPQAIVMDNGPELTSKAMFFWSQKTGIKLNFI